MLAYQQLSSQFRLRIDMRLQGTEEIAPFSAPVARPSTTENHIIFPNSVIDQQNGSESKTNTKTGPRAKV